MTTPQAQRRRQREIIWLLALAIGLLLVANVRQYVINDRIDDRQNDFREVQCNIAEQNMAASLVRNPLTQSPIQWARSLNARSELLSSVEDIGCPGDDFEDRRRESVDAINRELDRLFAQHPEAAAALGRKAPKGGGRHNSPPVSQQPGPSGGGHSGQGGVRHPQGGGDTTPTTPPPSGGDSGSGASESPQDQLDQILKQTIEDVCTQAQHLVC